MTKVLKIVDDAEIRILDFSMAFNTVNHKINLFAIVLLSPLTGWIQSFLVNFMFQVQIDDVGQECAS